MILHELCPYCDTWSEELSACATGTKKRPTKSKQNALLREQGINDAA
jgi:hypothetical protein